jgi:hypothetical protein
MYFTTNHFLLDSITVFESSFTPKLLNEIRSVLRTASAQIWQTLCPEEKAENMPCLSGLFLQNGMSILFRASTWLFCLKFFGERHGMVSPV